MRFIFSKKLLALPREVGKHPETGIIMLLTMEDTVPI